MSPKPSDASDPVSRPADFPQAFGGGLEWMQQLWRNLQSTQPGLAVFAPPLSLEDIDKRIADLKSVESWLALNLSMVQTTVHGLTLQRSGLVNLQAFSAAFSNTAQTSEAAPDDASSTSAAASPMAAAQWWALLQSQFAQLAQDTLQRSAPKSPSAQPPAGGAGPAPEQPD